MQLILLITVVGPTPVKQFKKAITDCDEEKAILIYTSSIDNHDNSNTNGNGQSGANDGTSSPDSQATSSQLATIVHPSKPFPSKKNQSGDTPLHLAAKFALMKLIMLLLENGGIPSTLNARMETSLHSVCSMSNAADVRRRILDMIITYNGNDMHGRFEIVSVNQVDIDGNAAIHHAAANGLLSCVEKLVANNAIISIVNKSNFTCCEMADNNNYKELAHMLELALLFQKEDAGVEEFNRQQEFPYDKQTGKLLLLSSCLSLAGKHRLSYHYLS